MFNAAGNNEVIRRKVMVMGSCECDKCVYVFSYKNIRDEFGETRPLEIFVENKNLELEFTFDTGVDSDHRRKQQLARADAIIIVFCADCYESYSRAVMEWLPMAESASKKAPILLVGTVTELQWDMKPVAAIRKERQEKVMRRANKFANDFELYDCVPCTHGNMEHAKMVFDSTARAAIDPEFRSSSRCSNRSRTSCCP